MRSNMDLQIVYPENAQEAYNITINPTVNSEVNDTQRLNHSLQRFFLNALFVSLANPSRAFSFFQTVRHQVRAAGVRKNWAKKGLLVPPIIIYSITNRCNLHCKGCYHQALRTFARDELNDADLSRVITEAKELGVSFMVIAGGEPLVRKALLINTARNPEITFFIFTNGLLIDEDVVKILKKQKNVVPIISLEGFQQSTDDRRGKGVYQHLQGVVDTLRRNHIFFGTSLTMTKDNFEAITDRKFVTNLRKQGCKLFFYVEYTAIREGTEDWVITDRQRNALPNLVDDLRTRNRALFVSVPGDEEQFGGCLAAGKGFVHISAEGNVEPCPFAPYSDSNLQSVSLRVALQSRFLKALRENKDQLLESSGGCVLWEKREWVESLLTPDGHTLTANHEYIPEEEKELDLVLN